MANLVWLHEFSLTRNHPVFECAGQQSAAFFIWDDAYLQTQGYSFKRLTFMYECLLEMDVTIYRGTADNVLGELTIEHRIFTPESLEPSHQLLAQKHNVTSVAAAPFATPTKQREWRRFFPYWNAVKKQLLET